MKFDLQGTTMQILNVELKQGEAIISESGKMSYMSDNILMETKAKGGLWKSIKRVFAGESFFLVTFKPQAGKGTMGFASEFPGKIIPIKFKSGQEMICQKDAFLCSDKNITFDATFTRKIGAGFLGGEGLILLKIKGPGQAFFNIGGEVTKFSLKPEEKIRVDTSCIAMFDANMNYSVERVRGIKNIIFGGEGLFLATITGPGNVWIQSMPIAELAGKLAQYMPSHRAGRGGAAGGIAAAVLKGMARR